MKNPNLSQTWKGSLTSILRNPSPERKPTKKPTKAEMEKIEKLEERGRKREKKYVSTMEVPIRGGSTSPNRHFYQDDEYFKAGLLDYPQFFRRYFVLLKKFI